MPGSESWQARLLPVVKGRHRKAAGRQRAHRGGECAVVPGYRYTETHGGHAPAPRSSDPPASARGSRRRCQSCEPKAVRTRGSPENTHSSPATRQRPIFLQTVFVEGERTGGHAEGGTRQTQLLHGYSPVFHNRGRVPVPRQACFARDPRPTRGSPPARPPGAMAAEAATSSPRLPFPSGSMRQNACHSLPLLRAPGQSAESDCRLKKAASPHWVLSSGHPPPAAAKKKGGTPGPDRARGQKRQSPYSPQRCRSKRKSHSTGGTWISIIFL